MGLVRRKVSPSVVCGMTGKGQPVIRFTCCIMLFSGCVVNYFSSWAVVRNSYHSVL